MEGGPLIVYNLISKSVDAAPHKLANLETHVTLNLPQSEVIFLMVLRNKVNDTNRSIECREGNFQLYKMAIYAH